MDEFLAVMEADSLEDAAIKICKDIKNSSQAFTDILFLYTNIIERVGMETYETCDIKRIGYMIMGFSVYITDNLHEIFPDKDIQEIRTIKECFASDINKNIPFFVTFASCFKETYEKDILMG